MEHYIKNNLSDITYMPELTPHPANRLHSYGFLGVGLIRTLTYSRLRARKSSAH
jgi:hypothetical protein